MYERVIHDRCAFPRDPVAREFHEGLENWNLVFNYHALLGGCALMVSAIVLGFAGPINIQLF